MPEYTIETHEPYTGATQRLVAPTAPIAAPTAADTRRADIPTWAMFAFLVVVFIIVLSRLPEQAPAPYVSPVVDRHVDILSNNRMCIGVFEQC